VTQSLVIHTCGTARNNPGSAGVGLVIETPDGSRVLVSENIGIATTAQAQYQAVIMALLWASEHKYTQVKILLNNAKMIRSLLHNPTIDDLSILGLHKRARRLARSLKVNFALYDSLKPNKVITLALEASLRPPADTTIVSAEEKDKQEAKSHHAIQQSAGGVLYKQEGDKLKVCLIAKKGGAVWALPKGRVQSGETWEMTATREVLEETGHLATIAERIDQIEYYFYWRDNRTLYYKMVTFFLMPLIQENASVPDGEASEVAWFDFGEAWRKLYYQSEKNILQQAKHILHTAKLI